MMHQAARDKPFNQAAMHANVYSTTRTIVSIPHCVQWLWVSISGKPSVPWLYSHNGRQQRVVEKCPIHEKRIEKPRFEKCLDIDEWNHAERGPSQDVGCSVGEERIVPFIFSRS